MGRIASSVFIAILLAAACRTSAAPPSTAPSTSQASAALPAGIGATVQDPEVAPATRTSPLEREIAAQNRAMEEAFRRGDLAAVAAFYADTAVLLAPGRPPIAGREAIDAYWARFTDPIDWKLEVLAVEGSDGLAIQRGRSTLTRRKDGEPHTSTVEFMVVWQRTADQPWRIAVDAYW